MTHTMDNHPVLPPGAAKGPLVGLSLDELNVAANMGVQRALSMIDRRRSRASVQGGDLWESNVVGMIGEYAIAKLLGVAYNPSLSHPDRVGGDVAGLQVRATKHQAGHLILRPSDPDGTYVLVIVDGWRQSCRVAGWVNRHDGARLGLDDPESGDVWVPQVSLAPWELLAITG